jgi:hypothetical protein
MADRDPEGEAEATAGSAPTGRTFAIPRQPERRYPRAGGVEYVGTVVFTLTPADGDASGDEAAGDLQATVETVLGEGPYQFKDFHELPMPLYLVRDRDTADTFRVTVRDGTVRLHVLPATESAGLRRFYERLTAHTGGDWAVRRRVEDPQST